MRRSLIRSVGPGMALLALGLLAIGLMKLDPGPLLAHKPSSAAETQRPTSRRWWRLSENRLFISLRTKGSSTPASPITSRVATRASTSRTAV